MILIIKIYFMYEIWNYKKTIKKLNITLRGDAWSARWSGFWIQEWKVMLDAGISSAFSPEHIFITHTHLDHVAKIIFILTNTTSFPNIYVPPGSKEYIHNYIVAYNKLNCMNEEDGQYRGNLIEVNPGDIIPIKVGNKNFEVKVFQADHTVVAIGFAFSEMKQKLKSEFQGKSGKEIKELKDSGVEITEEVRQNLLVYTGDTKNTIFDTISQIDWNSYKVIMTECTYIEALPTDKNVYEMSEENGHNVLEFLEKTAEKYPDPLWILCHWSQRYKREDIKEHFESKDYKNIIPWINPV